MKTNYKNMAKRYKLADIYLLEQLPNWKKSAIIECRKTNEPCRFLDEFVKEVIKLAENFDVEISQKKKVITVKEKTVDKLEKCGKI